MTLVTGHWIGFLFVIIKSSLSVFIDFLTTWWLYFHETCCHQVTCQLILAFQIFRKRLTYITIFNLC